ncbi:hypothetical protein SBADM41S_08810 [Streptomyces badius]
MGAESRDPSIAVVGMAFRLPGADTPEDLWRVIRNGESRFTRFTRDDLRAAGVPEELYGREDFIGTSAILDDIAGFDARHFGMTAREARLTDPQQRLFLECAQHALENAGYPDERDGRRIGVYASAGYHLYNMQSYLMNNVLPNEDIGDWLAGMQVMVGNFTDFNATRVAYRLGLTGPAINVQTACSSSLVGVQLAANSLLLDECDLALVGSGSIHVPQVLGYHYVKGSILSKTGHLRAFDASADGTAGDRATRRVLSGLDPPCSADRAGDPVAAPGLRADARLYGAAAALHCAGADVRWEPFLAGTAGRRVPLPGYRFQHRHYWVGEPPRPRATMNPVREERIVTAETTESTHLLDGILGVLSRAFGEELTSVAADTPFFDLGADSLLMINVLREIEEEHQVKVTMRELFDETGTPRLLAELIAARLPREHRTAVPAPAPAVATSPVPRQRAAEPAPVRQETAADPSTEAPLSASPVPSAGRSPPPTTARSSRGRSTRSWPVEWSSSPGSSSRCSPSSPSCSPSRPARPRPPRSARESGERAAKAHRHPRPGPGRDGRTRPAHQRADEHRTGRVTGRVRRGGQRGAAPDARAARRGGPGRGHGPHRLLPLPAGAPG